LVCNCLNNEYIIRYDDDDGIPIVTKGDRMQTFDISMYMEFYGKLPRGERCWTFSIKNDEGKREMYFSPYSTFCFARDYAREYFRDYPDATIYVMP
jgi:hypothetical protein